VVGKGFADNGKDAWSPGIATGERGDTEIEAEGARSPRVGAGPAGHRPHTP
jgi:hypothetical protein